MDGNDDRPADDKDGGEVVPFPGGRHPSQWPGDAESDGDDQGFDEADQAAGDFEPLQDELQSASADTYDLDARRSVVPPSDHPEATDVPEAASEVSGDSALEEKVADALGNDDDFEDFATGASSFDDFTREDYILSLIHI